MKSNNFKTQLIVTEREAFMYFLALVDNLCYVGEWSSHQNCREERDTLATYHFGACRTVGEAWKHACAKLLLAHEPCEPVQKDDTFQIPEPTGREQIFHLPKFLMNNRHS